MERNARRLYDLLSYTPREREEEPQGYVDNTKKAKRTTHWEYTFAASALKSASLLVGFCHKHGLSYNVTERGITVHHITNREINQARKLCNKVSQRYAISL